MAHICPTCGTPMPPEHDPAQELVALKAAMVAAREAGDHAEAVHLAGEIHRRTYGPYRYVRGRRRVSR